MSIPVYFGTLGTVSPNQGGIYTFAGLAGAASPGTSVFILPVLPPFLWTWDKTPAGPSGVVIFRAVTATFWSQSGFACTIQPFVDGVPTTTPEFLFNTPFGGEQKCEAPIDARGSRISAQLTFTNPPAALEFRDITYAFVPLRAFPTG